MGGVTKEVAQVRTNKVNYKNAQPNERGNLHERMKNLILVVEQLDKERLRMPKKAARQIAEALDLLENEIECYDPLPSYGQRQWIRPKNQLS
tara:strand:+ start:4015 stop:4290 length:276 start_codon:yes stop_codon:yes gene_type:complete